MKKEELRYQVINAKRVYHKAKKAVNKHDKAVQTASAKKEKNIKNDMIKKYYKEAKIRRHIEREEWQYLPEVIYIDGKTICNPRYAK